MCLSGVHFRMHKLQSVAYDHIVQCEVEVVAVTADMSYSNERENMPPNSLILPKECSIRVTPELGSAHPGGEIKGDCPQKDG